MKGARSREEHVPRPPLEQWSQFLGLKAVMPTGKIASAVLLSSWHCVWNWHVMVNFCVRVWKTWGQLHLLLEVHLFHVWNVCGCKNVVRAPPCGVLVLIKTQAKFCSVGCIVGQQATRRLFLYVTYWNSHTHWSMYRLWLLSCYDGRIE